VGGGGVAAATGQPLSGMVVIGASLTALAWRGGSSVGFFWRHELPGGYGVLMVEALWWLAGVLVATLGLQRLRDAIRPGLRGREGSLAAVSVATVLCALGASAGGAGLAWLVVRTGDPAQVVGGLVLSYAIAGGLAYLFTPYANPVGAVVSPLVGGIGVYGWVLAMGPGDDTAVLSAVYGESWAGLALALPIHLASAGVVGACLGVAAAQGLDAARREEVLRAA